MPQVGDYGGKSFSVANGASAVVTMELPRATETRKGSRILQRVIVRHDTDLLTVGASARIPVYAAVYLRERGFDSGNRRQITHLDSGWCVNDTVTGGGVHAIVGIVGAVPYGSGQVDLVVNVVNFSGATFAGRVEYLAPTIPDRDDASKDLPFVAHMDRLSTLQWGVYEERGVITQGATPAAALAARFETANGIPWKVLQARGLASDTDTMIIQIEDEDNNMATRLCSISSAAGAQGTIPQTVSNSGTSNSIQDSSTREILLCDTDELVITESGAGLEGSTLTYYLRALVKSTPPTMTAGGTTPVTVKSIERVVGAVP